MIKNKKKKKNGRTTFGNDFNSIERAYAYCIYIVETSLERFTFSHCQYYFISIKYTQSQVLHLYVVFTYIHISALMVWIALVPCVVLDVW